MFLWYHQCCVRVQDVKSESESSPQSQSQSHHLRVRVRIRKKIRVRVTNLVLHIFNICLSSKTWKQTTKCIDRVNSATRHGRYCLDSGVTRARVTISESESESESKWKKFLFHHLNWQYSFVTFWIGSLLQKGIYTCMYSM